jgi:hypothetical protein
MTTKCKRANLMAENAKRDLWFRDADGNCYFFPQGWADFYQYNGVAKCGELYGYAPTHTHANSPVETLAVRATLVASLTETTEEDARRSHPRLAEHLDAINAEGRETDAQAEEVQP